MGSSPQRSLDRQPPDPAVHRVRFPFVGSRRQSLRALAACGLAPWLPQLAAAADPTSPLAVLYPEIGDPFREVFAAILAGVRQQAGEAVPGYAVGADATVPALAAELRRRDVQAVIALGRSGLKAARLIDPPLILVAGCLLGVQESEAQQTWAVHSLAPDPALVFGQLRLLLPATRRVYAAIDPQRNAWLLRLAHEAARAQRLELIAHEVDDLKRATRAYQEIVAAAEPGRDALWLPQDATTVDDQALLSLVLHEGWQRRFAVVSSNPLHAKRGALFALYPDNPALGRTLGRAAVDALGRRGLRGLVPLRDVLVAANQRTAAHLGLALEPRVQRITKLYPES